MGVTTQQDDWAEETLNALATKGLRQGGARRAVVELLGEQHCCVTALEIQEKLRASNRTVGIASVYRILDLLTNEGLLQKIDVGSGIYRYEPVHRAGDHHHHLVCDNCGKVEPFEDRALERALDRIEKTSSYDVSLHDVVLHGSCGNCR